MNLAFSIMGSILVICIVILIHELGHFLVARAFGVKVLRFSLGFGKPLLRYVARSGTEYTLGILPLGGYVKMLGDDNEEVEGADLRQSYYHQPVLSRIAIAIAGPAMNFILAIVLFWIIFSMGLTYVKPVIGRVVPHSIAANAGLRSGDEIIKIKSIPTRNWQRVLIGIVGYAGQTGTMAMTVIPTETDLQRVVQLDLSSWKMDSKNPEFLTSLGIIPYQLEYPARVGVVLPKSPAAEAGLMKGDHVISINGKNQRDMLALVKTLQGLANQSVTVTVNRSGKVLQLHAKVGERQFQGKKQGFLGFLAEEPQWPEKIIHKTNYNLITAWKPAVRETYALTAFNIVVLKKMVVGELSLRTMGGPITIFQSAGKASVGGLRVYLGFIAFISVTLGFINLLPIPGLDGGHLLFYVIEGVFRRPVPERYQILLLKVGVGLLILLMLQATVNDILRMF